jgi:maltooligosyltrehalose trehalohydrolase
LDRPAHSFVAALQNHDQVANTFTGQRLHELTSPGRLRALTALLLLGPMTPMIFMGQEVAASTPFSFFAHQEGDLAQSIRDGRKKFMQQFKDYATPAAQDLLPDPTALETFERCKLDPSDRVTHAAHLRLHRDLLAIRGGDYTGLDGAVLNENAFLIRWFGEDGDDRLLLINLGDDLEMTVAPEPLLAPPRERRWQQVWSSDDCAYGGPGAVDVTTSPLWTLPAESAVLLRPQES